MNRIDELFVQNYETFALVLKNGNCTGVQIGKFV